MRELNTHDLQWLVRILPKTVREMMEKEGESVIVAGGYIRSAILNETPNDLDLFSPSPVLAQILAIELAETQYKAGPTIHGVYTTDNAYTVSGVGPSRLTVQFIHRWTYATPEALLESFDFTIACAAFWFDKKLSLWKSLCDDSFYEDLAAKRLVYTSPDRHEEAGGSLLRAFKFANRGFRLPIPSLAAVLARATKGLGGAITEQELTTQIQERLREVDPLSDPMN